KLCAGAAGNHLEFLHRVQSNVNGRALASYLLTKKTVVVVAAVKADVVEDAALPGKTDLVSVRALDNAHNRREGKKVFKFSSQNGSIADRAFIQRGAGGRLCGFNNWCTGDLHHLTGGGNIERDPEVERLSDRQYHIFLHQL